MPTSDTNQMHSITPAFFGRRQIFTSIEDITADNVISIVNESLVLHCQNILEEEYLYWYRRGLHPILGRKKQVRPEINNKVVENHADEIVAFKNGYFLTQPAFYICRSDDEATMDKVKLLNEYLYRSGKQQADNEVVDWFHTVGKAAIFVQPKDDKDIPVEVFALDPRRAFVVYSLKPGNRPVMGVNMVIDGNRIVLDVFTERNIFHLLGGVRGRAITNEPIEATAVSVESVEPNRLGRVPIIEYQYNSVNMGAFESVISLLDAIDEVASNRIDGIEQFIQSLLVFYNCQLGDDEDGNAITPAYIREAGAIFLKSIGQDRADLKELSSQLDQTQTQVLVDYMYQQVLTICGMPTTTKGGSSTSDTGAAVLARDGWYQADTVARNTEDLFRKSNRYFDELFLEILRVKTDLDLRLTDIELHFVRNETANIQSKAQALNTLLASGVAPTLAFAWSGVSKDPQADVAASDKYIKMRWGDPNAPIEQPTTEIIEQDRNTGDNETGGAV